MATTTDGDPLLIPAYAPSGFGETTWAELSRLPWGAGRSRRGDLREPKPLVELIVRVKMKFASFCIEREGAIDVANRNDDDFELVVQ
jgi:hypothetical protein